MRSISHVTPRYVRDRFLQWKWARRNPNAPWLTRDCVNWLDQWLKPADMGLEFGSGRSTLWLATRVGHLTSVESNANWYRWVYDRLSAMPGKVDYRLHEDGESNSANSAYVQVAGTIEDACLDFVLVDGAARDHCARVSLAKLKPGGVFILDNAERYIPRAAPSLAPNARAISAGYASGIWREVGESLASWRCIWTTDGVSDTAIWHKPSIQPVLP